MDTVAPHELRNGALATSGTPRAGQGVPGGARAGELYGYYSRIDSGEPFERHSRVGDQADIIVRHGLATVTLGPGELLTLRAK